MKVFISVDMEGISGIVDTHETLSDHAEYPKARAAMAADVNAAIEGVLETGAAEIMVCDGHGKMINIEPEALHALERYSWPGNVRQLINAIERGKIMAETQLVRLRDLPHEIVDGQSSDNRTVLVDTDDLSKIERAKVIEILRREAGNKTRAARKLGIDRRKLYRLVEKYNIQDSELTPPAAPRSNQVPS